MHIYIVHYLTFFYLKQAGENIEAAVKESSPAPTLLIVTGENTVQQVLLVAEGTALLDIPIVNLCSIFRILLATYYVFHRAYTNAFLQFLQEFMLGDTKHIKRTSKYMVFVNRYKL